MQHYSAYAPKQENERLPGSRWWVRPRGPQNWDPPASLDQLESRVLQAPRPSQISLNYFFGFVPGLVEHEYEISNIFIDVYFPRRSDFETHFTKFGFCYFGFCH